MPALQVLLHVPLEVEYFAGSGLKLMLYSQARAVISIACDVRNGSRRCSSTLSKGLTDKCVGVLHEYSSTVQEWQFWITTQTVGVASFIIDYPEVISFAEVVAKANIC